MLFQQVTNGNGESYIFVCFQFILCSYKKERVGGKRTDSLCMYTWEDAPKIFLRICLLSPPRIRLRPYRTSVLSSPCPFPLRGMRIQTTIKGESFIWGGRKCSQVQSNAILLIIDRCLLKLRKSSAAGSSPEAGEQQDTEKPQSGQEEIIHLGKNSTSIGNS